MANTIDEALYPDNNSKVVCRPTLNSIDSSGNDATAARTGLTDLECYLSLTQDAATNADAIHADLVLALDEEGVTGVYHGVMLGSDKRARLASLTHRQRIYAHWQSVIGGYHEVSPIRYYAYRTAGA